jgi:hypothetical protein
MPEGRSAQPMGQGARPVSAFHALGFECDVAAGRHDQCQRQLGRRYRRIALASRHGDAERGAGGKVDHLGIAADERDQLEPGQPFEQRPRKFHPFADRDDHVGIAQAFDQVIDIACGRAVARDLVAADERKAVEPIDHVLIVVGNDNFHRAGSLGLEQESVADLVSRLNDGRHARPQCDNQR